MNGLICIVNDSFHNKNRSVVEKNKLFLFMNTIIASFANIQKFTVLCGLLKGAYRITQNISLSSI